MLVGANAVTNKHMVEQELINVSCTFSYKGKFEPVGYYFLISMDNASTKINSSITRNFNDNLKEVCNIKHMNSLR